MSKTKSEHREEWLRVKEATPHLRKTKCRETGKVCYKRKDAGIVLYNCMWLNFTLGYEERNEKNIYQCGFCNAWHLTSKAGLYTDMYEAAVKENAG